MTVRLRRSKGAAMGRVLSAAAGQALTYDDVGMSLRADVAPAGFTSKRWSTALHRGSLARGREALRRWNVHEAAGLTPVADGQLAVGTNVAMSAPLPVGFVDVTCRIVAVIDEPLRYGFAYGTLANHPECGEEAFLLEATADGAVAFRIHAVSRPRQALAKLVPAVAAQLQEAATRRYLRAMVRLTT